MAPDIRKKRLIQKIISVFAAILIWLFITYAENPQIDVKVNTIPIQFAGESELIDNGYMVTEKSSVGNASIVLRGKRRDLMSVMGNISASINVADINDSGSYKLRPTFDIPSSAVYIAKRNTNTVEVNVAKISKKTVDVRVIQKNKDKNKSYIIESIPELSTVTISGFIDDIKNVMFASLYIDVGSMLSDNVGQYDIVYEDENGSAVSFANDIFTDIDSLEVSNKIYDKTELDVNIIIPETVNNKYSVQLEDYDKKKIYAGIKDKSASLITSVTNTRNFDEIVPGVNKYNLELDIPKGLYVLPEDRFVSVELEVFERVQKTIIVPVTVQNASQKNLLVSPQEISILVSGPEELLKKENISVNANLSEVDLSAGPVSIYLQVNAKDDDIKILSHPEYVKVQLQ